MEDGALRGNAASVGGVKTRLAMFGDTPKKSEHHEIPNAKCVAKRVDSLTETH